MAVTMMTATTTLTLAGDDAEESLKIANPMSNAELCGPSDDDSIGRVVDGDDLPWAMRWVREIRMIIPRMAKPIPGVHACRVPSALREL